MKLSIVVPFAVCFLTGLADYSVGVAAETKSSPVGGETRFIDELYRVDLLPRLQAGETCKMFSSYDRTGGNDDGFSGKYSILRKEGGDSVLAEMKGPGCIQRMHFPHSEYGVPGLLGRKGEHVRIYLDGAEKPALDVPLEDIFYGKAGRLSAAGGRRRPGRVLLLRADPLPQELQGRGRRDGRQVRADRLSHVSKLPRAS